MRICLVPKESINGSGIGAHDSCTLAALCGQLSTACSHPKTYLPGWNPFSSSLIFSINLIFASCLLTKCRHKRNRSQHRFDLDRFSKSYLYWTSTNIIIRNVSLTLRYWRGYDFAGFYSHYINSETAFLILLAAQPCHCSNAFLELF